MIRIESIMQHGLNVPYPSPKGVPAKFFTIPPAKDGKPGVLELDELDSVTLQRLMHHYVQRPKDMKEPKGEQIPIGLLTITDTAGRPLTPSDEETEQSSKKNKKAA